MIELALANAFIVITLAKTSLFKPLRNILPNTPVINLKQLFHCSYCLTPWTSALILYLSPHFSFTVFDFIIKTLALATVTSIFAFLLLLYLKLLETK